jgi:hypothetical protein
MVCSHDSCAPDASETPRAAELDWHQNLSDQLLSERRLSDAESKLSLGEKIVFTISALFLVLILIVLFIAYHAIF